MNVDHSKLENQHFKSNFIGWEFPGNVPLILSFPELIRFWHRQKNQLDVTAEVSALRWRFPF